MGADPIEGNVAEAESLGLEQLTCVDHVPREHGLGARVRRGRAPGSAQRPRSTLPLRDRGEADGHERCARPARRGSTASTRSTRPTTRSRSPTDRRTRARCASAWSGASCRVEQVLEAIVTATARALDRPRAGGHRALPQHPAEDPGSTRPPCRPTLLRRARPPRPCGPGSGYRDLRAARRSPTAATLRLVRRARPSRSWTSTDSHQRETIGTLPSTASRSRSELAAGGADPGVTALEWLLAAFVVARCAAARGRHVPIGSGGPAPLPLRRRAPPPDEVPNVAVRHPGLERGRGHRHIVDRCWRWIIRPSRCASTWSTTPAPTTRPRSSARRRRASRPRVPPRREQGGQGKAHTLNHGLPVLAEDGGRGGADHGRRRVFDRAPLRR